MQLDGICLTRNEDVWSKTVRDSIFVSTYPLAMWLASSWWRLNWEPLPMRGVPPSIEWRMAHELGAADHGFVWPRVLFASDGEIINVWAKTTSTRGQSVNYICGLDQPRAIKIADFQDAVDNFISAVLDRLSAVGCIGTDLAELWELIREDRSDEFVSRKRRLEAQMGFDPEECPEEVMEKALALQQRMGDAAMSELAPIYGRRGEDTALEEIVKLSEAGGIKGKFSIEKTWLEVAPKQLPWQQGVEAARKLRTHIGIANGPVNNATLFGLFNLSERDVECWSVRGRPPAAVAVPVDNGFVKFVPRKTHPIAKRFEFARFLGDHVRISNDSEDWLASTDLATSRQKYQRAFAAEFLCPISGLVNYLNCDFTELAIEDASSNFDVSVQTIESLLMNNGYLPANFANAMPY